MHPCDMLACVSAAAGHVCRVLLFCKKAFKPEPPASLDATLYAQQSMDDSGPVV